MTIQDREIARVNAKIAPAIEEFFRDTAQRIPRGRRLFHLSALDEFVAHAISPAQITSGSVSRILRQLRSKGRLDYRCVSRAESLYEALT